MSYLKLFFLCLFSKMAFGQVLTYETRNGGYDSKYELRIYKKHLAHWQEIQKAVYNGRGYPINKFAKEYVYDEFYKDLNHKKIYQHRNIGHNKQKKYYLLVDSIDSINWELTNEKETILGYKCLSAKATYRGRTYTAYYTTEIPIAEGPFKFGGLPGMILKVMNDDPKDQFFWKCVKIDLEQPSKTARKKAKKSFKTYNSNRKEITWETFKREYAKHLDHYIKNQKAKKGRKGLTMTIFGINSAEIYNEQYQSKGINIHY